MAQEDMEEQPLDPVLERVRRKMMRLMVISIGIMMVGLLAVLFAIIYKFNNPDRSETAQAEAENKGSVTQTNLELPANARVVSTSVDSNRMVLEIAEDGKPAGYIIVDTGTGNVVSRISLR